MSIADRFSEMSVKVSNVPEEQFAGAFLVVLPDGRSCSSVLVAEHHDPGILLLILKSRIESLIAEVERDQKPAGRGW